MKIEEEEVKVTTKLIIDAIVDLGGLRAIEGFHKVFDLWKKEYESAGGIPREMVVAFAQGYISCLVVMPQVSNRD